MGSYALCVSSEQWFLPDNNDTKMNLKRSETFGCHSLIVRQAVAITEKGINCRALPLCNICWDPD